VKRAPTGSGRALAASEARAGVGYVGAARVASGRVVGAGSSDVEGGGGGGGGRGGGAGGGGGWGGGGAGCAGGGGRGEAPALVTIVRGGGGIGMRRMKLKRRGQEPTRWVKIPYVRRLSDKPSDITLCLTARLTAVGHRLLCLTAALGCRI
jgi:hypothetical protein